MSHGGADLPSISQNYRIPDVREATGVRLDLPAQYAYLALRAAFWANDRDFIAASSCAHLPADAANFANRDQSRHWWMTQCLAPAKAGRSRVPWLSGTASWAHLTATNYILGIRPEGEGLRIDPCMPSTWPGFTATPVPAELLADGTHLVATLG